MQLDEDWEFNVLGLYNYNKPGKLSSYFKYIIENHDYIEGDIVEAGVFKGRTLISTGLLLKEIGSDKQVYGYESFMGLKPVEHKNDSLSKFDELLKKGRISKEHYSKIQRNIEFRSRSVNIAPLSGNNISLSGDFSETSLDEIKNKLEFLGLDNVHIVEGLFQETMIEGQEKPKKIMAASLDCDYYMSYKTALPFIYNRMSKGGYIHLDEYYSLKFPGARIATYEFCKDIKDKPQFHQIEKGLFERWYLKKLFN